MEVVSEKTPSNSKKLFDRIVNEHNGIAPTIVQTDCGTEFKGEFLSHVQSKGSISINSAPRHPQSQGSLENQNAQLKKSITYLTNSNDDNYESNVQTAVNGLNNRNHSVNKLTPVEVMKICMPLNEKWFNIHGLRLTTEDLAKAVNMVDAIAKRRSKRNETDRRKIEKAKRLESQINVNDEVWVRLTKAKPGVIGQSNWREKYKAVLKERKLNGHVKLQFISDRGGPRGEKYMDYSKGVYRLSNLQKVFESTSSSENQRTDNNTEETMQINTNHASKPINIEPGNEILDSTGESDANYINLDKSLESSTIVPQYELLQGISNNDVTSKRKKRRRSMLHTTSETHGVTDAICHRSSSDSFHQISTLNDHSLQITDRVEIENCDERRISENQNDHSNGNTDARLTEQSMITDTNTQIANVHSFSYESDATNDVAAIHNQSNNSLDAVQLNPPGNENKYRSIQWKKQANAISDNTSTQANNSQHNRKRSRRGLIKYVGKGSMSRQFALIIRNRE